MEIMKKLMDYESGEDYEPLKVEMYLKSPLYINTPWINLDSIVQMLCFRDALGEDFYSLPSDITIRYDDLNTPIKKTKDVYHSSVGKFNVRKVFIDKIYKRFTDKEADYLTPKKQGSKIRINSGYFKDYMIQLPAILTSKIDFYTCADYNSLKILLSNLKCIGKKTSIGGGRLKQIKILKEDMDYSFFKDGEIMRTIPVNNDFKIPVTPGMGFSKQNYKPPYWDKSKVTMCITPPNQLLEVLKNA